MEPRAEAELISMSSRRSTAHSVQYLCKMQILLVLACNTESCGCLATSSMAVKNSASSFPFQSSFRTAISLRIRELASLIFFMCASISFILAARSSPSKFLIPPPSIVSGQQGCLLIPANQLKAQHKPIAKTRTISEQ